MLTYGASAWSVRQDDFVKGDDVLRRGGVFQMKTKSLGKAEGERGGVVQTCRPEGRNPIYLTRQAPRWPYEPQDSIPTCLPTRTQLCRTTSFWQGRMKKTVALGDTQSRVLCFSAYNNFGVVCPRDKRENRISRFPWTRIVMT